MRRGWQMERKWGGERIGHRGSQAWLRDGDGDLGVRYGLRRIADTVKVC